MQVMVLTVWILQGLLMFFDEFYFHHKRGLGRWESLGHPIDTLFFIACFIYTLSFDTSHLTGFILLASASCLIITKDEFVHSKECDGGENWLHAVLFVIHPIALFALYHAWINGLYDIIKIQTGIIAAFGLYQLLYWNLPFRKLKIG
jgi:hypothetical protein